MSAVVLEAIDRYSRNHSLNAELAEAIDRCKIKNIPEFLGQVFVESANLSTLEENLNYSADALIKSFYPRRISKEQAYLVGRTADRPANPQKIANQIYGGVWGREHLGNTQPNDGWFYRGRGPIQLTGRDNVTRFANWYNNGEIVTQPSLIVTNPRICVSSACWFWVHNSRGNISGTDVALCTRAVTGSSTKAYDRRLDMTRRFTRLIR